MNNNNINNQTKSSMNRIMTLFAALVLSCTLAAPVFAQGGYEVKGIVVDQAGPVIGVSSKVDFHQSGIEKGTRERVRSKVTKFGYHYKFLSSF